MKQAHALKLVNALKQESPKQTYALYSKIELVQITSNGFVVIVGTAGDVQGREPSKYAWFTEHKNSSKGWIKRTCEAWAIQHRGLYNTQQTNNIDDEEGV